MKKSIAALFAACVMTLALAGITGCGGSGATAASGPDVIALVTGDFDSAKQALAGYATDENYGDSIFASSEEVFDYLTFSSDAEYPGDGSWAINLRYFDPNDKGYDKPSIWYVVPVSSSLSSKGLGEETERLFNIEKLCACDGEGGFITAEGVVGTMTFLSQDGYNAIQFVLYPPNSIDNADSMIASYAAGLSDAYTVGL